MKTIDSCCTSITDFIAGLKPEEFVPKSAVLEFPAVVTHLIQNPDDIPPFLTPEKYSKLLAHTSKFVAEYGHGFKIPYPPTKKSDFRFIDLFAGIGGFRQAMQGLNGKCVFSSEWDFNAKRTYFANYGELPYGDIREISSDAIPQHDILCAGFPCQPFSLAGVSKKESLGRKHGFLDETQGTLFFEIARILKTKRPAAFFLENVKNLKSHDKGVTFSIIIKKLESLGYTFNWDIVDGSKWVPQHRERIFIVGFDAEIYKMKREDIVIPKAPAKGYRRVELNKIVRETAPEEYTLGPGTWAALKRHKKHHAEIGNGFGYSLHDIPIPNGSVTRTISARYHKDGGEILIAQETGRPRRLTVGEAMQLQGLEDGRFVFPVSKTQAYRQIGNSVVVPAIQATAEMIVETLNKK